MKMKVGAMLRGSTIKLFMLYLILIFLVGCSNPFSPKLANNSDNTNELIADQLYVEGIFTNFKYAYTFKDTSIYGNLLSGDFQFTYRDYDIGVDIFWGRDEEMKVTSGLFRNSQELDLVWNNIVSVTSDSSNIVRSFNLSITFNPTEIIYINGKVNLQLVKKDNKWEILTWTDESNF